MALGEIGDPGAIPAIVRLIDRTRRFPGSWIEAVVGIGKRLGWRLTRRLPRCVQALANIRDPSVLPVLDQLWRRGGLDSETSWEIGQFLEPQTSKPPENPADPAPQ